MRQCGALSGGRCAIGLAMPIADAAESLGRRALGLSRAGILDEAEMASCEDILVELGLLADEPLIDQLAQPRLGALLALGLLAFPGQGSSRPAVFAMYRGGKRAMLNSISEHFGEVQ